MLETPFGNLADGGVATRLAVSVIVSLVGFGLLVWLGMFKAKLHRKANAEGASTGETHRGGGLTFFLLSVCIVLAAAWVIAETWQVPIDAWIAGNPAIPVRSLIRALVILTVATAAMELTGLASRLLLDRIANRKGDRRNVARMRTVAGLISGLANAVILIVAAAMLLSEAGIQIAPLLAGAGVAGIAIGFGAQSLVKDLFTGAFLITEDIVSQGDIVEIGGVSGRVEEMTLRTIRLRSFDGTLHIFPYGEAQVIHNKTASFSCFAFEMQISYLSDIGTAMDVLMQADTEIRRDPELAKCMLQPLDLGGGPDRFHDNGVILKGRIRTQPDQNGRVGAEFLRVAKLRLDEAGVLIAHRHLPVPPYDLIKDQVHVATPKALANGDIQRSQ